MSKYLDDSGLSYLWSKLKALFALKADSASGSNGVATRTAGILYGQVDSTSTSKIFTAQIAGVTSYYDGLAVLLKNGVVTSASGFTININGLGGKPAVNNLTAETLETTIFNVNYTMLFVYDSTRVSGGCWICYRGYDANTNTIGYQLRTNSSTMPASDKFYRYRILFTSADGEKWVPSTTSTSTNATAKRDVNQRPIDPFGEIVYYGTTTAIEANANVTAAQLWQQYTMTLGYAFNRTGAALVLPFPSPIYIKCAPQADGSAIIDEDNPYVFTLPNTEDGKIYIYLGRTYSATAIEITMNHPVYYYKDGVVRPWTNAAAGGAVTSVNGQTGTVVLDAEDVGALPDDTVIPSKTSDLTNDSNFITAAQAPVQSVNGQTGVVTVDTMPSATGEADGTALVAVDGVWTKQTGYGYKTTETGELANYTLTTTAFEPAVIFNAFEPSVGSEYMVVYDGVTYTLTAIADTVQGYGDAIYFGNGQLFGLTGGDPNAPFVYGFILAMQAGGFVTATSGEHTIVINGDKVVRHNFTLDYVPIENVAGVVQHKDNTDYLGMIGSIRAQNGVSAGVNSVAFGQSLSYADFSFAEGYGKATGDLSHAEGNSEANGNASHAEGNGCVAAGMYAHAEGQQTNTNNTAAHAEGSYTNATGQYSHSEGYDTEADGQASHAEGWGTQATGDGAHAEGYLTEATLDNAHAEGSLSHATGVASHAEGSNTQATLSSAHAEGSSTLASGEASHAEGIGTIASRRSQHVFGEYNVADATGASGTAKGSYIEVVGKGAGVNSRSNARTLDWNGNEWVAGSMTAAGGFVGSLTGTASGNQAILVSGTNIKTINNESILGSGNLTISGGLTPLTGTTATVTPTQVSTALGEGRAIVITHIDNDFGVLEFSSFNEATTMGVVISNTLVYYYGTIFAYQLIGWKSSDEWETRADILAQTSDIPTNTSDLTNDSNFITSSQAPVQSVNGQTGAVTVAVPTKTSDLTNDEGFTSVSVTASLSSGTKVGTITVDGVGTDLYAPTNTDTKVTQTYAAASGYTYWRPLVVGYSNGSAEGFTPATQTNTTYTFSTLKCQPSSGTIKANIFKGNLTGDVTGTASGNLKSGDNVSSLTNDVGYLTLATLPIYNGGVS